MKRIVSIALAALSFATTAVQGQVGVELHVGGGITQPTGNFGDAAKLGWHGLVTFALVPNQAPFAIQASGFYGQNNFKPSGGKWKLAAGLGEIRMDLGTHGTARGHVMAGGGAVNVKAKATGGASVSETKGAFDIGAGFVYLPTPEIGIFLEGRYVNVFVNGPDITFIPITAGVRLVLQ
jgi:opacity protein-like surface antigen